MSDKNPFVKNMLGESRKRMVGSLMSYLETNVYPKLTQAEQEALRLKVLTSVGAYHDCVLDITKASVNDGSITNEYLLDEIYDMFDAFMKKE